jgi:hypothetical protein
MKSKVFQEALKMKDEALTIIKNVDATIKENHILIDLACEKIQRAENIIKEYRSYVSEVHRRLPKEPEELGETITETRAEDLLERLDILGKCLEVAKKQLSKLYN